MKQASLAQLSATALRNSPGVSSQTRKRILKISQKLGYVPDARIHSWMAQVREAKEKDLLPITWLNTIPTTPSWNQHKFLSPYLEGAKERAKQLGYKIEEFWTHQPGMKMSTISRILYQRGIEGVILTYPAKTVQPGLETLCRGGHRRWITKPSPTSCDGR